MDRQGGGKRQMHFKMAQPLEAFGRLHVSAGGIIAHRTPVVRYKTKRCFLWLIGRDELVIRVRKGAGVIHAKCATSKILPPAASEAIHLKRRTVDLLKAVVIPVRHGGQRHRVIRVKRQTRPDQAKALLHGVVNQVQLRRYRLVGAGGNTVAAAIFPKRRPW